MTEPYYIIRPAYCKECNKKLEPAEARHDGEPCLVGYNPCPDHPKAGVNYEPDYLREARAGGMYGE